MAHEVISHRGNSDPGGGRLADEDYKRMVQSTEDRRHMAVPCVWSLQMSRHRLKQPNLRWRTEVREATRRLLLGKCCVDSHVKTGATLMVEPHLRTEMECRDAGDGSGDGSSLMCARMNVYLPSLLRLLRRYEQQTHKTESQDRSHLRGP